MLHLQKILVSTRRSVILIKIRIWFYCLAFIHLSFVATLLLSVDFTTADDPRIWIYQETRWKLITTWFNLIYLVYAPISIYCEYKELQGDTHRKHVQAINQMRNLCFTSILFPTIMFSDILFWRLWNKDRELLALKTVDQLIPFWSQHSMHTVSLLVGLLDLVLVPRQRPMDLKPGFVLMTVFIGSYTYVCTMSILQGEFIYPVFKLLSTHKLIILIFYVYTEHIFYFMSQWCVIDLI